MTQTTAAPRTNPVGRRSPYIFEDWDARIFRVNREVFRSEEIFARERRLWDRLWLYLGHETEVPKPGDFKVRTLAGRPLIFARDSKGQVRAYLNACPHRGTILCRETEGNAKTYQCFYHAWTFANTGELVRVSIGQAGFNHNGNVTAGFFIKAGVESGATQSAPPLRSADIRDAGFAVLPGLPREGRSLRARE